MKSMLRLTRSRVWPRAVGSQLCTADSLHGPWSTTRRSTSSNSAKREWSPDLYVFNKYGTLINIHAVWPPWVEMFAKRLESTTGLDLEERLYSCLDICRYTKRVRSGVVGEGTAGQVKHAIETVVESVGLDAKEAQRVVDRCWEDCVATDALALEQMSKLRGLFGEIKSRGSKIAVYTTDEHDLTVKTLEQTKLLDLVDHIECTESPELDEAKLLAEICWKNGVSKDRTVVVGDTTWDMRLGRSAPAGLTVGVLSGIGTRLDLSGLADLVADDVYKAVAKVQEIGSVEIQTIHQGRLNPSTTTELVIFDKDGTLLCFHSLWTPWAQDMISRLESATGLSLATKVLPVLGYIEQEQKWRPSVFTQGTTRQSKDKVADVLQQEGLNRADAEKMIDSSWPGGNHSTENVDLRPLDDPTAIFKTLKANGIRVAVCTSDCRKGTEQFLDDLGATEYVDMLMCGDDADSIPKPAANNALLICEKLGVDPAKTLMVGDTQADMTMGRNAKLGATVAVLSGVGDVAHLEHNSDHILPSIGHVIDVIKKASAEPEPRKSSKDI